MWRLDRLGRTARGLTALFDDLQCRQVGLVSLREGLDLSTPAGRLMANVVASVAQYETEVRGERVKAGQAVARANGVKWGGSQKGRRLKVTPQQIRMIRQMKEENETVVAIAKATGPVPGNRAASRASARRWLSSGPISLAAARQTRWDNWTMQRVASTSSTTQPQPALH